MRSRVSLVAVLAMAIGCEREIVLGDSDSAVCVGPGCGGGAGPSVEPGMGGSSAGSVAQAGASAAGTAGTGGSTPSEGGTSSGGEGGQPSPGGCQPSAMDEVCDGLDEACALVADDAGCPGSCEGTFVDGTSYMSCLAARDFDEAEAACQANGMHLAKIDDERENATVLSLALDDYVWIGGQNRDDSGVFTWLDGTTFYESGAPVVGTYQNFGPSGPSSDPELRCVQLRELTAGTWSMWRCSGSQSFVCERYDF